MIRVLEGTESDGCFCKTNICLMFSGVFDLTNWEQMYHNKANLFWLQLVKQRVIKRNFGVTDI